MDIGIFDRDPYYLGYKNEKFSAVLRDLDITQDPTTGRTPTEGERTKAMVQIAQKADVWTLDIHGEEWGEVDFPPDVEAARALVARWDRGQDAAAA